MEVSLLNKILMQQESPFFIKDVNGKYLYINYEAAKLAGLDPDKFIGRDDIEIFGKEIGNIYREKDLAVIRGEIINPVDIFINANGEKKAYFIARQKVYNKQTQLIGISGIRVDITEHLGAIASIKLK